MVWQTPAPVPVADELERFPRELGDPFA